MIGGLVQDVQSTMFEDFFSKVKGDHNHDAEEVWQEEQSSVYWQEFIWVVSVVILVVE